MSQGCKFINLFLLCVLPLSRVESADNHSLLRMEGWNGTTSLSLSYSDGSYSSEEAETFLRCMKELMIDLVA